MHYTSTKRIIKEISKQITRTLKDNYLYIFFTNKIFFNYIYSLLLVFTETALEKPILTFQCVTYGSAQELSRHLPT